MKVYVAGYGREESKKPEKITEEDLYGPKPLWVGYSAGPELKFGDRARAEYECTYLEGAKVRVDDHCCAFTLEELPEGEFAVVCLSHPELMSPPRRHSG